MLPQIRLIEWLRSAQKLILKVFADFETQSLITVLELPIDMTDFLFARKVLTQLQPNVLILL